ncbi:YunC family protein [Brevibacillus sp. GCM10020057]|uniref:YunC family protein n=1 Tax=Brevibacillus sp. GCM10020057 TaxID=3317327 RepID=UPI003637FC8D
MVEVAPVHFPEGTAVAVTVRLPKTTLLAVTTDIGYIMCGALDVRLLNERLASREIVAGRAVGVKSIQELLDAPLESVTTAAEKRGITAGMIGRDAVIRML